ncbi:hypothetical protein HK102_004403, partial [Quaeritorhiza haematococci]
PLVRRAIHANDIIIPSADDEKNRSGDGGEDVRGDEVGTAAAGDDRADEVGAVVGGPEGGW